MMHDRHRSARFRGNRLTFGVAAGSTASYNLMRIGVVGCGSFGPFAMQQFTQVPGVEFAGLAETHREASILAARRFGVERVEALRMAEAATRLARA